MYLYIIFLAWFKKINVLIIKKFYLFNIAQSSIYSANSPFILSTTFSISISNDSSDFSLKNKYLIVK